MTGDAAKSIHTVSVRVLVEFVMRQVISAVEAVQELIRKQPELGRRGLLGTFSFRTRRFPFCIVYELQTDRSWIVAVAHLSRRRGDWSE